jgi:hypothetical protein
MMAPGLTITRAEAQGQAVAASEHSHFSRQRTLIASIGSLAFSVASTVAEIVAPRASTE